MFESQFLLDSIEQVVKISVTETESLDLKTDLCITWIPGLAVCLVLGVGQQAFENLSEC